jgi:hypothetical protein
MSEGQESENMEQTQKKREVAWGQKVGERIRTGKAVIQL